MSKKLNSILPLCLLFFYFFLGAVTTASGQSWVWGRYCAQQGSFEAWAVATDGSGNAYGGGTVFDPGGVTYFFGSFPVTPYLMGNGQSMWVKYDASGNALWAGGTVSGVTELDNMAVDPSGNLIILGSFSGPTMQIGSFVLTNTSGAAYNFYLAKISPAGTVLWAINDGQTGLSGVYDGKARGKVTTDAAGNIYIASGFKGANMTIGSYTLTNTGAVSTYDIFVAKYSTSGSLAWVTQLGGTYNDYASGITVSSTGYIYICGSFSSPSLSIGPSVLYDPNPVMFGTVVNPYAFIGKLTMAGVPIWGQAAGGTWGAYSSDITTDNFGHIYMIGGFSDTSITLGPVTLTRPFPSSVHNLDMFLIQYSSADVATWGKTIGCVPSPPGQINSVTGYSVTTYCNQVWVDAGYSDKAVIGNTDTINFIPGPDPLLIAGFNTSGNLIRFSSLPTGGDDQAEIATDPSGNLFLCGDYWAADLASATATVVGPDTFQNYQSGYYFYGTSQELFFMAKYLNTASDTSYAYSDTAICNGTTGITLTAPPGYTSYLWNDGEATSAINITSSGHYFVYCLGCGVLIDTFNVTLAVGDSTTNHNDTAICGSASMMSLGLPAGYVVSVWNTGSHSASISITDSGTYWVLATEGCTTLIDTFHVKLAQSPIVDLANDTIFCAGNSVTLSSAQPDGTTYLWSTGETTAAINVFGAGAYWLRVTNVYGCSAADTAQVSYNIASGQLHNVTVNQTIPYGSSIQLNVDGALYYMWAPDNGSLNNPNINNPIATPLALTTYTVYGLNVNGCRDTAYVTIDVIFDSIFVPTAFTPNGDGLNDVFRVGNLGFYKLVTISVYNRWGSRVYYSDNGDNSGWDGTYSGVPQDMGVYYYDFIVAAPDGKNRFFKGDVTLIR